MNPTVIIVGSGPAGVSAAWPLVRAGVSVVMLDAAEGAVAVSPAADSAAGFRADPARWRAQFGGDLAGLAPARDRSPKFATPLARSVTRGYAERLGLETRGFFAAGALARGGLSTLWGALAAELPARELERYPGGAAAMQPFYDAVRARIGVPAPSAEGITSPAARRVFKRLKGGGMSVAPAPNAVLDRSMEGRHACSHCGLCLWGCSRRAIYDAADELPALGRFRHFEYRPGHRVRRLVMDSARHALEVEAGGERLTLYAETVLLAAGTIATAALALPRLGLMGRPAPLLTNPAAATAFVVPALIGAELPLKSISLGQLFYRLPESGGDGGAAGVLYGADALPLELVAARLPLSRPVALRLARALAPALVMATCYLPGPFSRNRITVGEGRVLIEGEILPDTQRRLRASVRTLGRAIFPAALPLPGATSILEPGADAHYAGVLPMGGEGPFASGLLGEIAPGLHVVDGACLPTLTSTHPTLTIMANATRIAEELARRLGGAG